MTRRRKDRRSRAKKTAKIYRQKGAPVSPYGGDTCAPLARPKISPVTFGIPPKPSVKDNKRR